VKGIRDMHVMRSALSELNFPTSAEDLMKTISWPQPKLRLSDTKTLISQIRFSLTNRRDVSTTLGHFQARDDGGRGSIQGSGSSSGSGKIGNLIVTPSISKVIEFITAWISGHEAVILVGSKGVGKNAILEETFFPQGLVVKIFCTPDTTSSDVIHKLKECCSFTSSGSSSRSLRANNGAKLILYLRHLELLRSDEWGSVSVIAFLTSLISQSGFYDESSLEWVTVQNFIVICTCIDIERLDLRFVNRVHVSDVSLPPLPELEQIICGLSHPSLPDGGPATWRSSFAAFFVRVLHNLVSGHEPRDVGLDVMRICIEILSNVCRYEGVPDQQIMQLETRRVLINYCPGLNDKIDSLFRGSPGFSREDISAMSPADSRLYPYASGFGNRLSLWSGEKFRDAVQKCLSRFINETESFINEIGLIPEMLDVFAVAGTFLSDATPGIQAILFTGSSASGRKLSLRVIAHQLGYDLVWSPRAKLSEKHLMNELRNFTESVSESQPESLAEERRILMLLDPLHFITMPFLLKHLLTFYWEESEKRRERRATSTSSPALVIRIGVMRQNALTAADYLLWSRFARVTLVPDYSSQSLRTLPVAIDPAIDVSLSEKFYHILQLFPHFDRDKRRFLSLILTFKHLFQEKKVDTENRRREFVEKISKLESTTKEVAKLKEEANEQKEVLARKRKEADDALGLITSGMTGAEDQRIELEVIRNRTENEAAKLNMGKKEIDEELSLIEPALQAAKAAVGGIKSESLSEIRSLRAPPEVIRDILEGRCLFSRSDQHTKITHSIPQ
jgi:dynein heavy chain 2